MCVPERHGPEEDIFLARCLYEAVGVKPYDTRDRAEGSERFHPSSPFFELNHRPPSEAQKAWWYHKYHVGDKQCAAATRRVGCSV